MSDLPLISRPIEVVSIRDAPLVRRIALDARERKELAEALGLVEIDALAAEIVLRHGPGDEICLEGRITAQIVQTCVVSLDPIQQNFDEAFEARFVEGGKGNRRPAGTVDVGPDDEDPPEVISGPSLDLGPVVVEQFLLAVDPYPRGPGAEAPENPVAAVADAGESPFGVLASLARRDSGKK